ncbi:MAG TPA: 30S ribosomal protein S17e [Candidatus Nanoarchaeia archaeon]|nr:30S ribosomal protein S17e [Candidatus Nanoarchaeia archaeon]
MGRIKTILVKRTAIEIFTKNTGVVQTDFESNKKIADTYADIPSKKLRNNVAGYLTRLKRQKEMKDKKQG